METGSLLSAEDLKLGSIKRVSAKSTDNGIIGEYDTSSNRKARHYENFISVNFFGDVFYHPYKASVEMKVHVLKLENAEFSNKSGLYFATAIKKSLSNKFGYGNQLSSSKLKELDLKIIVPFLNDKIDISFMEKFIGEIEKNRIEALDRYLTRTELKNYTLTPKDTKVLDTFDKLSKKVADSQCEGMCKRKLGTLFKISASKKKFNADSVKFDGTYPYVARGENNNGIRGYINEDVNFLNKGDTISFGQDTATMFYQRQGYFTGDKIKVLESRGFTLDRYNALYYITVAKKTLSTFSWGSTSYNVKNLENIDLEIPVNKLLPNNKFMSDFIRVIEKLVIKDVILWLVNKNKQ